MLKLFDPTLEPELEPHADLLQLIPMYRSPKIELAKLPGKLCDQYTIFSEETLFNKLRNVKGIYCTSSKY